VLRYGLEASGLTISEMRCGTLQGLSNLLPTTCGRAKGVGEAYVFSMGEQLLRRLGVPFTNSLGETLRTSPVQSSPKSRLESRI
jgi:hypothetical protein